MNPCVNTKGTKSHMMTRNTGSEKNRPLYFFDNKKYGKRQAKSANTISIENTRVASNARSIKAVPANVELAFKYAGTALARKGETRTAPPNIGSNQ